MRIKLVAAALCLVAMSTEAFAADDTKPEVKNYTLILKNHKFEPSKLTVPANTKFTLTVKNEDPTPAEFESNSLRREKVIKGGESAVIKFGPMKPGEHQFEDEFHPTTSQGLLTVK